MSKSDKEIDQMIHEALSKEEAEYFDKMGEQNIPQQLFSLFKGKNWWMNVLMVIMNVVVLAIAVYTFIHMLDAEVIDEKLEWMFYTLISFMAMMLFKLWGWNQMDKNVLMREIKRLEYQVSLMKKENQ
ncbi:DUF6768 family protein [Roseivirga sp.]|uniref:DUF6768 family protein n=1 Tax=Roseivirga sp. TaxID=1964215 RepID=UPI003B8E6BAA